jgi:Ca2+-binding RTX toxin-like protein
MTINNGLWREGGSGDDTIDLGWQAPWDVRDNADGGAGNDTIYGNIADNQLNGGDGNDIISGGWGDDIIDGGNGNDQLIGDEGNDTITGDAGADLLDGGSGDDFLDGGAGDDNLFGRDGNDELVGGTGNDFMSGGAGNDTLMDSTDFPIGAPANGNDVMYGGDGNDFLFSINGADKLWGDAGNDTIQIENFGHNHLADAGLEIHGGTGWDTLVLEADSGMVFNGLGAHTDGMEAVAMDFNRDMTLNLSFRDVINDSPTHSLVVSGDAHDTLNLTNFVPNDPLSGGHWVLALTEVTADPNHVGEVFNYQVGSTVEASVQVDNSFHVNTPLPPLIHPDIHI